MSQGKTLTTAGGAPVADNQNFVQPGLVALCCWMTSTWSKSSPISTAKSFRASCARQRLRRLWHIYRDRRHNSPHPCQAVRVRWQANAPVPALFHGRGERGSADTERDPRGFAVKFYTEGGNWDVVGNNTPVFFIRDPLKFPDFIHTQKRDPWTNLKSPQMMWDFWSHSPEALHQVTILFSDRGIPDGYRFMHGFGSHTFSLVNSEGERHWVKFHFKSMQGIRNLHPSEAARLAGSDPDYAQRIFPRDRAGRVPQVEALHPGDERGGGGQPCRKSFRRHQGLVAEGVSADRSGDGRAESQSAELFRRGRAGCLCPEQRRPGIGLSPDRMLQGRVFAYADAHRYRVGTNHQQLPVNAPRCPVHNYQRDGAMRFDGNGGSAPNYEPNSYSDAPKQAAQYAEPALALSGAADRYDHRADDDYFSQAGALFRLMTAEQQNLLIGNIVGAMAGVSRDVQLRQLGHFFKADPAYGAGIARDWGSTRTKSPKLYRAVERRSRAPEEPGFLRLVVSDGRASSGLRKCPVCDCDISATSSGVPLAMI